MKLCAIFSDTVDDFSTRLLETIAQASLFEMTPVIRTTIAAAIATAIYHYITARAHVDTQHAGVELEAWTARMYEESRLVVEAIAAVGVTDSENGTLGRAAAEVAGRVLRGEKVVLRVDQGEWSAYELTEQQATDAREALGRGETVIVLDSGSSAVDPQDPSALERWSPLSRKAN